MNTRIIKIDPKDIDIDKIDEASKILSDGGLVAFPTETVYGLGGDALNPMSSEKIYKAKGRPSDNPLIVHIEDLDVLRTIATDISQKADKLIDAFWPGPMTLIFNKTSVIPHETTGGLDTVAIRMPIHPVAAALINRSGLSIAAPSANTSGRPSTTKASHCIEDLDGKVDMIIDSGSEGVIGLESTIIDMTSDIPVLLRPGFITVEMIEKVVGHINIDKVVTATEKNELPTDYKPKAPGMKYKHYAPKADLTIYYGNTSSVTDTINKKAEEDIKKGIRVGIMCTDETCSSYIKGPLLYSLGHKMKDEQIAANLFDVLRKFDETDVDVIYGEAFFDDDLGMAIMNRLTKASGYKILPAQKD